MENFVVAHVQKFKAADIRGIEIHYERSSANLSNKDIDSKRTADNYNLMGNGTPFRRRVKELVDSRSNPTGTALRKDAVQACSVLVSASPAVFKGMSSDGVRRYFQSATDWLCNEFGRENAVGAYVHMDEETPHLHFVFVPLTADNRLSAKDIIDRNRLQRLQSELPKYLQEVGFAVRRGLENSPNTHIDTKDWKREEHLKNVMEEELLKVVDIEKTPEKTLFRIKKGRVIVDQKDLENVQEIALQEVENRLEKRRRYAQELRELRNLKADTIKQQEKLDKQAKKQAKEADRLTKQALEQSKEADRLKDYELALKAQDDDLALQRMLHETKRQAEMLSKREAELLKEQERLEETIRKGIEIGLHNALKKIALSKYEGHYMSDWKKRDPKGYEKAMREQQQKDWEQMVEESTKKKTISSENTIKK